MAKMRYSTLMILMFLSIFIFSLENGESLIGRGHHIEAIDHFMDIIESTEPDENGIFDIDPLTYYYLSLAFYKTGQYQEAFDHLEPVFEDNNKKIGFNVLMGLILIKLNKEHQGMRALKSASLLEGIRLRSGLIVEENNVRIAPRIRGMISRVNSIDPEGMITYDLYHLLLLEYYKRRRNFSSLSVEYEKLILNDFDNIKLYEELIDVYKRINYYESLDFLIRVYNIKFGERKDADISKKLLIYSIVNAENSMNKNNYINAKTILESISIGDLKKLGEEHLLKYYELYLNLFYAFNLFEQIEKLLITISRERFRSLDMKYLMIFSNHALSTGNIELAYHYINRLNNEYPDELTSYLLLAKYFLLKKDNANAFNLLYEIKKMPEKNFLAHYEYSRFKYDIALEYYISGNSGYIEHLSDAYEEINIALNNVRGEHPDIIEIYSTAGKIYYLQGLSIGTLTELFTLEDIYRRDRIMKSSQLYFEKAKRLDPNNIKILEYLGWTYIYLRDYENAFSVFTDILKINPFYNEAKLQLKFIKNAMEVRR